MRPVPRLFAEMTLALDDLHATAAEGQCAHVPAHVQLELARDLRSGLAGLNCLLNKIGRALGEQAL